jgi:hypothetical protein
MKKTTLGLAAALVLGGLSFGIGSASAASADVSVGAAPTAYVQMHRMERRMMRHRMERRMMRHHMERRMMRHRMMRHRMHGM